MSESSDAYKDGVAVGTARQFNDLRDANLLKGEAAPSTDVQQLKAEILRYADEGIELCSGSGCDERIATRFEKIIAKLSAV